MYDIIIIGAGIAGMTSAIYAARAGKKVLILEQLTYGGQIVNSLSVENYPGYTKISGFDLATNIYNQVKELDVDFKYEKVEKIENKEVITNKQTYNTKAIIIATGLNNRKLNIPNEDNLIGKGVSYCATCDGNFYRNKVVTVVGGGNTAIEDALFLSNICKKVYLIHRRDTLKAEEKLVNLLKEKDNVTILYNSTILNLISDDVLKQIEISKDSNKELLDIDALFIAIGKIPNNNIFSNIVELNDEGYIKANDNCETSKEYIFVAGDCREKKIRQLVTAANDGAIAALSAVKYLEGEK